MTIVNFLSTLLTYFYCLPISHAILFIFFSTVLLQAIKKKFAHTILCKTLFGFGLIIVVGVIFFTTVSSRPNGEIFDHSLIPFHSYRDVLNGGDDEILRSNFMNVVLFYPAGLLFCSLLPQEWRKWCKILLSFIVFCALSCGIEYMQYAFSLGHVEIDDVIHNSLGALLGAIFSIVPLEPWRWFQIVHPSE